jgi:hypothetical protein
MAMCKVGACVSGGDAEPSLTLGNLIERGARYIPAVRPPSMVSAVPVIQLASSEAR